MKIDSSALMNAMRERHSVKKYNATPLTPQDKAFVGNTIAHINATSGLNMQLIENEPEVFRTFISARTGLISAHSYIAMVGTAHKDLDFFVGYWGELLVLLLQSRGIHTNWTGGTRRLGLSTARVQQNEKNTILIALGYGENSGKERSTRPIEALCSAPSPYSPWLRRALHAAQLAPTGYNRQKFHFTIDENGNFETNPLLWKANITAKSTTHMPLNLIDLGIATRHFELGASNYFSSVYGWEPTISRSEDPRSFSFTYPVVE
ncbi:MAG: hypothetical protein J6M18_02730 [Actinomycetaceae bacterium]|nr:hypothetical protein [Actinomycetaceae bacterium]